MLLASSITPSGHSWALESASRTLPDAPVIELHAEASERERDVLETITEALSITGAQSTSADLIAGIGSLRDVAALVAAWERQTASASRSIVSCRCSIPDLVLDLHSLRLLAEVSGSSRTGRALADRLQTVMSAFPSGAIEWLLAVAPQPDAWGVAKRHVALASGAGVFIRGVVMAPMPRKRDGWPKAIRQHAREVFHQAVVDLHPIPIARTSKGNAPKFPEPGILARKSSTVIDASGNRVLTFTVPGLSSYDPADVEVGTWSADTAYPTTHVVLQCLRRPVWLEVEPTLRRCRASDVVVAGDTIAVEFHAVDGQWPRQDGSGQEVS